MTRRKFTEEFKMAAVARMGKEETATILKDLKIGNSVLYKWREQLKGKNLKSKSKKEKVKVKKEKPLEAIIYLRQAREAMNADLIAGRIKKLDKAHLLSLLALQALGGDGG